MASSTDKTSFCRNQVTCKCWSFHNNEFFFSRNLLYILQAVRWTVVLESKFRGKKYFTPKFKFTSTYSNSSSKYDISTGHIEVLLMHLWTKKCKENVMQYFPGKEVCRMVWKIWYIWKKDSSTLRMLNIRGLPSDTRDMSKSIMEMMTSEPSIIFQPDVKYASCPYTIPAVIT